MSDKALTISYFGKLQNVEKVFFSFSYRGNEYAFVSFDKENKDLRVLKTKFSLFKGNFVDSYVTTEIVVIGEAIFNNISGVPCFMSGEHYTVNKINGEYDIKLGNRLRRFKPGAVFISSICSLLYSFVAAALGIFLYFSNPGDWRKCITKSCSAYELAAICIAACCLFIFAGVAYRKRRAKGTASGIGEAALAAGLTVLIFGLIARPSVRIIAALLIPAIAAGFTYGIFRIRKMRGKRAKEHALSRLLRKTKIAGVLACAALMIFSGVLSFASPYVRNRQNTPAESRRIEQRFESACSNLKEDVWETLSEKKKLRTLQSIVDYEALENDSFSAKVAAADLNTGYILNSLTRACYSGDYNTIFIDRELGLDAGASNCLLFLLHEYRHCYQDWFSSDKSNSDNELAQRFRENFENYSSAKTSSFEEYESQLLETDGNYFAYNRMEYYSQFLSKEDFESSEFFSRKDDIRFVLKTFKSGNGFDYALTHPYENGKDTSGDYITLCAYTGRGNIDSLEIPYTIDGRPVRALGDRLVRYVPHLEKIKIPSTVTEISPGTFKDCDKLTVEINPKNCCFRMIDGSMLVSYDGSTLHWVDRKTTGTVTIPKETTTVLWDAFTGCKDVTDIAVEPGNEKYRSESGMLINKTTNALALCPEGKTGVAEVPGCSVIRTEAFLNCSGLTEIIIPDTVKKIESRAFSGCDSLLRLDIPSTVEEISSFAFEDLMNLERLSLPGGADYSPAGSDTKYLRLNIPSLADIYFDGTEEEWEAINVKLGTSDSIFSVFGRTVTIHFSDGTSIKKP